ncbi:hypothetical protein LSTR_LSTR011178 [Laodelphax striatellus]|uniref:Inward rectifier potassium channel C-terminal domain-containing protein n=1 Tax=Laodelphax striatellus TaxID=195883 RepID=A0A482XVN4_LAOST|nr:hypothetical protein LSTR_LSTR011178 [Laodelphax striatellus]
MESQQFTGGDEEGRNYLSSSSDEALPAIVSEKIHPTNNGDYDGNPRMRRRAILKDGYTNAFNSNVPLAGLTSITQDFFTFMMECRWRTLLLLFFTSFLLSWLLFAALYWAVAFGHGDLRGQNEFHDPTKEPCITMMDDFISCFMFSMETQYSSGYGTRSPTTECPDAMFLVGFQSIFGALLQLSMSGIIFAKFARPKMRQQAIMFSQKAVISVRDRHLCLMFRLGDCRKSRLLGATVSARLLQHRVSVEGEKLPLYQHALKLSIDSSGSNIFLLWPLTAVHRIDSTSPLYDISADDLTAATFEIFVALAGTVETMGQDTEARTSYTASEILWGHRLVPLVKTCGRGYILDYSRFHSTVAVDTPRCSARQLYCWTHNYVLFNKNAVCKEGFLGSKNEFLEHNGLVENKDDLPGNKGGASDNKQGVSDNKGGFKDAFLDTKDQGMEEKDGILPDQDNFSNNNNVMMLCSNRLFLGNQVESLANNIFSENNGRLLDTEHKILCSSYPSLGNTVGSSDKNILLLSDNDRLLTSKDKFLGITTERLSNKKEELLNRKDEYFGTKDAFLDQDELLDEGVGLLDNGNELLDNKKQYSVNNDEFYSTNRSLEYREENELTQNLTNSSGPVRKFSAISGEDHQRDLHHSLMSLLDKKQRTRLTTLSEDDLR